MKGEDIRGIVTARSLAEACSRSIPDPKKGRVGLKQDGKEAPS
jgi:hypothetical protein